MKVIKKLAPARTTGDPGLLYVAAPPSVLSDKKVQAMLGAIARDIPKLWICVLDSSGNGSSFANRLSVKHAGVILASKGELTRAMYRWSSPEKPFLVVPASMAKEIEEKGNKFTGLLVADSSSELYDKLLAVGVRAQNFVDADKSVDRRTPMAPSGLTLYDIQAPKPAAMQRFLKKWSATSLNRAAFLQLLADAADLYSIPEDVLVQLAKYEYFGLRKDSYYSSFRGGYNDGYSGPFQVGSSHYSDTKRYFPLRYKVTVPRNRDQASLGLQVASSVDAIRRGANASPTLRRQPLDAIGFYLIHNQGAGGAVNIINNTLSAKTRRNLAAQSDEVKAAISSRYGIPV